MMRSCSIKQCRPSPRGIVSGELAKAVEGLSINDRLCMQAQKRKDRSPASEVFRDVKCVKRGGTATGGRFYIPQFIHLDDALMVEDTTEA